MIKLLYLDIETAPHLAYAWGLIKENIPISRLVEPGFTLCWAARWHGDKEVHFRSAHSHTYTDMLQGVWDLIDEADAVIHFNGKKFDMPTLNKEFIKHNIRPPSPYEQIDLYHTVRRMFRFASNKLDFVCQELGIGSKVQHKGMELWDHCRETMKYDFGEVVPDYVHQSWAEMEEYNRQDTVLLEQLYLYLLPWIPTHPNVALWMEADAQPKCTKCGSGDLRFKGYKRTKVLAYKQYLCNSCGSYSRARHSEEDARKREDVLS